MQRHLPTLAPLAGALLLALPCTAAHAQRMDGEPSRTPAAAPAQWRLQSFPEAKTARLRYGALAAARVLQLERELTTPGIKAVRVGVARQARSEATGSDAALRWVAVGKSGAVARIEARSPDARALRVGLKLERLDDRDELRFAGSADPARIVAVVRGAQAKRQLDAQGLYWTPSTDGEAQTIEVFRPAGVRSATPALRAPSLSHLVVDSRSGFRFVPKAIGDSGACNVDTVCRVPELGQAFVNAKNAVAHMQFVQGGTTYICTGTLLNDGDPTSQVPWFYGANHCFTDNDAVPPVPSQMQGVANTLNTFWNFEATACNNRTSAPVVQRTGGADYLYSNNDTDAMLLRLRDAAPAGAFFAAWNAATLPASSAITGIHHPAGDLKKVSTGQRVQDAPASDDAYLNTVAWLNGTTEGGSSGSGLFTIGSGAYELRGGLYGGFASCANTGSPANTRNRDYYSRFDVAYPFIRQYLDAPIPRNGSQPLLPPRTGTASAGQAASAAPATQAMPASTRTTVSARAPRMDTRTPQR